MCASSLQRRASGVYPGKERNIVGRNASLDDLEFDFGTSGLDPIQWTGFLRSRLFG